MNCMGMVDATGMSLSVTCEAANGIIIASLTCTYDNGSRTEDCRKTLEKIPKDCIMNPSICLGDVNGTFTVDITSFSAGVHLLFVMAIAENGEMDTADMITFTVAPLSKYDLTSFLDYNVSMQLAGVRCRSSSSGGSITVRCESSNTLIMPSLCTLTGTDTTDSFPCE